MKPLLSLHCGDTRIYPSRYIPSCTINPAGLPTSALALLPLASLVQISLGALAAKVVTSKRFNIRPALLGIDINDEESANDIRMCTTFANSGPLP